MVEVVSDVGMSVGGGGSDNRRAAVVSGGESVGVGGGEAG